MLTIKYLQRFGAISQCGSMMKNKKISYSKSSSSSSSSDDENVKKKVQKIKTNNPESISKLNTLLQQMITENNKPTLELAKPKSFIKSKAAKKKNVSDQTINNPTEKQILDAAKRVAESIGGDVKQTESELLAKLLSPAVDNLLNDENKSKPSNLSDIIVGMKIDRTGKEKSMSEVSRANQVRKLLNQNEKTGMSGRSKEVTKVDRISKMRQLRLPTEKVDLFGSKPLGIFAPEKMKTLSNEIINKTWDELEKRELKLAVTHPPSNYFQEMILWTEQGKIWKFPIDNEQDIGHEKDVYFAEHIFLDKYLEPWCPKQGPIRHFMELVCVGLSKNPYISVQNKKDHIEWFKNYFLDKKQMLIDIGAFPQEKIVEK